MMRWFLKQAHTKPTSSRHEYVVAMALLFVISGMAGLLKHDARPESVVQLVPTWLTLAWLLVLLIGGITMLGAMVWPNQDEALGIEWPAYVAVGGGALIYGLALAQLTPASFVATVTYMMIATLSVLRAARIVVYILLAGKGPIEESRA